MKLITVLGTTYEVLADAMVTSPGQVAQKGSSPSPSFRYRAVTLGQIINVEKKTNGSPKNQVPFLQKQLDTPY